MIRSIAQLKAWFRRGKYPTEEQFSDWMDSYVHKEESEIPMSQVTGLTDQLNGKYSAIAGAELEQQHAALRTEFETHKAYAEDEFENIEEDRQQLVAEDQRQQGEIDVLNTEVENIHAKNTQQDVEITALHQTDTNQQSEIDTANTHLELLRKRLHPTSTFAALEGTFATLGTNYNTLFALASTIKTFLEANDTANSTINRWKEIEAFLQGITDADTLSGLLEQLRNDIAVAYANAIAAAVKVESDRAKASENVLQSNINTEKTRAEAAETALDQRITNTRNGLQQTDAEIRQDISAIRQTIIAMQTDSLGRVIPLVMNVVTPHRITLGNTVKQYVKATLLPIFAIQNVLWMSDGKSVEVEPDGEVIILGLGISRVHVIPTENTALHQTVTIEVVKPSPIRSNSGLILAGNGIILT